MSPISNRNVNSKFTIVLYELYHPLYHGFDDSSDRNIKGHFLVHSCYHSFQLVENGIVYPNISLEDIERSGELITDTLLQTDVIWQSLGAR